MAGYANYADAMRKARFAPLTKDHIVPLCKMGRNGAPNIVFACKHCNNMKGGMYLQGFIIKVSRFVGMDKGKATLTVDDLKTVVANATILLEKIKMAPALYINQGLSAKHSQGIIKRITDG